MNNNKATAQVASVLEHEVRGDRHESLRQPSTDASYEINPATGIKLREGFYTVEEILDLQLGMKWAIDGILPAAGMMILSGDCGLGKSYLALDLAIHMCNLHAAKWLGHFDVLHGPVVYVDLENGMPLIQHRLRRLGALPDDQLHICYLRAFDLTEPQDVDYLRGALIKIQPVLIIFDSLRRFHSSNENAADCMSSVMETINTLHPAAKLVLHHCRKQNGSPNNRMRGSTDLSAVVDSHVCLEATEDGVSRLVHAKSRWQKPHDAFCIRWVEDGDTQRFEYDGPDVSDEDQVVPDDVLDVIESNGGAATRQQLLNALTLSEASLDRWLKKYVESNALRKERVGREVLYCLPNNGADNADGIAQIGVMP